MSKPGPAKGEGGRPRTPKENVSRTHHKRVTVGKPSKGKRVYEHRAKVGLANTKGTNAADSTVVHHKDGGKSNALSNLKRTTRRQHPKEH